MILDDTTSDRKYDIKEGEPCHKLKQFQMDHASNPFHKNSMHTSSLQNSTQLDPNTPEENQVKEHLNYTLLEHECVMLLAANLPKFLYAEAVQHAMWLKNCMSMQTLNGKTLFEICWHWAVGTS